MDPNRAMSQYVHDRWGADQGFPKGPVYAITQTTDGYLWIGTEAGLIRFDGWNFRLIRDESGTFTIASVLGLVSDDNGCLWARLQDLALVRYCHGVFERPSPASDVYTRIEAMSRTNRGELLVSRMEAGAFAFRDTGVQLLAPSTDLPRSPVTALSQTSNGDLWMGTRDSGLFRFRGGKTLPIRSSLPDLKINYLLPEGNRGIWVGTDGGVARWDGNKIISSGIPAKFGRFQALLMVADRDANTWIGTDSRGLLRLNSKGFASMGGGDDHLSEEAITALFEDREGSLWIGHADGIERLRDSAFVTYSLPEGLPTDGAMPVFVDSEDRLWFPPTSGGLWWTKNGQHGMVNNDGLNKDIVYSIAGGKGQLWLGRQRGGLTELLPNGSGFTARTFTQADGLAQDSVYSVYLTRDNSVWAGTLSAGVSMLRNGKFRNYSVADGLVSNTVVSILEGSDGTMWFATPSGLSSLSHERWQTYTTSSELPSENVNCLLEDASGVLWVGTESGIAYRESNSFHAISGLPPSLRAQVLGLADDKYGGLWITTSNRVLRADRNKLIQGRLAEDDVREYGLPDGLRGVEGVKRHRSIVADAAGRIWISVNHGISVVDPARLSRNSPVIAQIEAISADGDSIGLLGALRVPGGRQRVTLAFAGLGLSLPERVHFRYRLEGFDRHWSNVTSTREAVYTNLPPGPYRFRVMASNPEGVWSGAEADLAFEVIPLFWQTWWFVSGCALAIAAIVLGIFRFRLHQVRAQLDSRFSERLGERTRIAQELHDTLLQGFLSASMQVHVAADCLPADSRAKPILVRALELMGQVTDEGRNALRGLRSSESHSIDLERSFLLIHDELMGSNESSAKIDFRVVVDGVKRPLHPLLRDEVYRIGREALLNAFRHAQAERIEVELKYSANQMRLLVRDDGCGIDQDVLRAGRPGHWGLLGIRERAARIGAHLTILSGATAGTEIELSIPGNVAFREPANKKRGRPTGTVSRDTERQGLNGNGGDE